VSRTGFTLVELLVVIGIIALLAALAFPVYLAHLEAMKAEQMKAQLKVFQSALELYHQEWGAFPPSAGSGANAGIEAMLAALRSPEGAGPFIKERRIRSWTEDTDDDGRAELVDPWRNPWIYFHPSDYAGGGVYYMIDGQQKQVAPVKKGDTYENLVSFQLWACGPNATDESGRGDDCGNVGR
jgi:general secretion pathway protein G